MRKELNDFVVIKVSKEKPKHILPLLKYPECREILRMPNDFCCTKWRFADMLMGIIYECPDGFQARCMQEMERSCGLYGESGSKTIEFSAIYDR
jgi:hypothetical protein